MPSPSLVRGWVLTLLLAAAPAVFAAESSAPQIVTTVSGERFIGTLGSEDAESVRLVSKTLGEIRIPRAAIASMTLEVDTSAAAVPASPVVSVPAIATAHAAPPAGAPPVPEPGFIQSGLKLPGKFDASLGLGLMAQSGVLEQTTAMASMDLSWEVGKNLLQSQMQSRRQTAGGNVYDDSFKWDTRFTHNLSPRTFWLASVLYRENTIMAVKRQGVLFAGPGFNVVKTPKIDVVTVVGPAYIRQYYLAAPGMPPPPPLSDPAAVWYQSFGYNALPKVRFNTLGMIVQSLQDKEKQLAELMVSMDVALSNVISLSNAYTWQRDSRPRVGISPSQGTLTTQLKIKL